MVKSSFQRNCSHLDNWRDRFFLEGRSSGGGGAVLPRRGSKNLSKGQILHTETSQNLLEPKNSANRTRKEGLGAIKNVPGRSALVSLRRTPNTNGKKKGPARWGKRNASLQKKGSSRRPQRERNG